MEDDDELLKGIVEADETYIGGKPRYRKNREIKKSKRGRGTKKASVIGAVERGGKVVAKLISDVTTRSINRFVTNNVDLKQTTLMTDEYKGYNDLERNVISQKEKKYVDGDIHSNTIEGFWSEVKRAFHGTHHWYSKKWLPLYIQESCFKRNHRNDKDLFVTFLKGCVA